MFVQPKPRFFSIRNILIGSSISLNILLLWALIYLANRMGYLGRFLVLMNANKIEIPTDTLSSQPWWQDEVKYQVFVTQNRNYDICLFGDSISSGLENTLGDRTFNFALPGMSTISEIEQLKALTAVKIRCQQAIIALGTNDADYRTTDDQFVKNMKQIISTVRQMGANRIILLPAFYSTVAASHDVSMAGTIERVEEINRLIRQVAVTEKVLISASGIQSLYDGQALKGNLTTDGVHLNADGRKIYRDALLKIQRERF